MQLTALKQAGCKTIFKDELSGATGIKRPALLRCLKKLEHGDMLVVWKLDRLGRSLRDLITMLDGLYRLFATEPLNAPAADKAAALAVARPRC